MVSYSERETKQLVDSYLQLMGDSTDSSKVVDKLSVKFNRTRKSIIAKLSKEGLYIGGGYRDKQGDISESKLDIVRKIEDILDSDLDGLYKAPKFCLKRLHSSVYDLDHAFNEALDKLADVSENKRIRDDVRELELVANGN